MSTVRRSHAESKPELVNGSLSRSQSAYPSNGTAFNDCQRRWRQIPCDSRDDRKGILDRPPAMQAAAGRVSISRVAGVTDVNAPRRAVAPVPDARILRAALMSAFCAWPQATHRNSAGERREPGYATPHALQVWEVYAGFTAISSVASYDRTHEEERSRVSSPVARAAWC